MSKPGGDPSFGISSGDDMILPGRHPACRRREAQSGSCTERENLCCDAKGEVTSGYHREGESTDAEHRDGAARSSAEGPVMGVGAKGLRCSAEAVGQLATGGACGRGKAVRDPETGGLGSFRACEGEPGSGWSGWTVDSRVRGQPCGQPLQALESDVLGELLPSAGAAGGDSESGWGRGRESRPHGEAVSGSRIALGQHGLHATGDTAFYAKRRSADHGNETRANSSESSV